MNLRNRSFRPIQPLSWTFQPRKRISSSYWYCSHTQKNQPQLPPAGGQVLPAATQTVLPTASGGGGPAPPRPPPPIAVAVKSAEAAEVSKVHTAFLHECCMTGQRVGESRFPTICCVLFRLCVCASGVRRVFVCVGGGGGGASVLPSFLRLRHSEATALSVISDRHPFGFLCKLMGVTVGVVQASLRGRGVSFCPSQFTRGH